MQLQKTLVRQKRAQKTEEPGCCCLSETFSEKKALYPRRNVVNDWGGFMRVLNTRKPQEERAMLFAVVDT